MAFSREFIFPEREEFKRAENSRGRKQEGEEKCVLGIYPLLLDTPQWLS